MAVVSHVAGLATVKINDGTGPGLQTLGYTRDGVEISEETFWGDIPGDERGGEQGPPVEIQWFGAIARVRCELTKWDDAVATLVRAAIPSNTAGSPYSSSGAGTLVFSGTKYFRLLIASPTEPRNFIVAIPRSNNEINKGTKFSTQVFEFECHADSSGVLWNTAVI